MYEKSEKMQPIYPTAMPLFKKWAKVEKQTTKIPRKRKHGILKVMF